MPSNKERALKRALRKQADETAYERTYEYSLLRDLDERESRAETNARLLASLGQPW